MSLVEEPLRAALHQLAQQPRALVASDYDGVLAPIVTDPAEAYPLPSAVPVLRALAELPGVQVALLSGRARAELARLSGLDPPVALVGGHGAEFADELVLTPDQTQLRERLRVSLAELVASHPGTRLEQKPASLVVHTRTASPQVGAAARAAAEQGPGRWPGVQLGTGKEVVELSVVATDKGTALTTLREQAGGVPALFLGDDLTDENAFAVLGAGDIGVKVGPGQTRAGYRVSDPPAAVRVLEIFYEARCGAS